MSDKMLAINVLLAIENQMRLSGLQQLVSLLIVHLCSNNTRHLGWLALIVPFFLWITKIHSDRQIMAGT